MTTYHVEIRKWEVQQSTETYEIEAASEDEARWTYKEGILLETSVSTDLETDEELISITKVS